ncbi:MAG: RimK/LysX family protein [Parahaliea sp.]
MLEKVVTRTVPAPVPVKPALVRAGKLNLPVIGLEEWATIEVDQPNATGLQLRARIDTGAEGTWLSVLSVSEQEQDGQLYVRFELPAGEEKNEGQHSLEAPVQRSVNIKRQGENGRRYVIRLWLKIGGSRALVDVNLVARDGGKAPLQVGRNFLTDEAIVDVGQRYIAN